MVYHADDTSLVKSLKTVDPFTELTNNPDVQVTSKGLTDEMELI